MNEKARSIKVLCQMFGINPPRLLTERDIEKVYRKFKGTSVPGAIWGNVQKDQDGLTDRDIQNA
jgi:hypothetical protein